MLKLNFFNKITVFVVLVMALPFVFKESAWGFNYLQFLSSAAKFIVIILGVIAFLGLRKLENSRFDIKINETWFLILLPVLAVLLTQFFPLSIDIYGDSRTILTNHENFFNSHKSFGEVLLKLLDPNVFDLHNGEKTTLNLVYILHEYLGFSVVDGFNLINIMAVLFSAIAFSLIAKRLEVNKVIASALFISGNYMLQFSGHIEVYSLSIAFAFVFALALQYHLSKNSQKTLVILAIASFALMKTHISNVLILPVLIAAIVLHFNKQSIRHITPRNMLILAVSSAIGFFLAYFFVFKSYSSNYALRDNEQLLSNVFLPIFSNEPPFNHYSLFNLNHVFDWLNLLIMWSPIALVMLFTSIFSLKTMAIASPIKVFISFLVLAYALIGFVVNPLLSMPRDWDLLSLGAPFLIVLSLFVFSNLESSIKVKIYPILALTLIVLIIPRFWVETSVNNAANRLLIVGKHVHNTYYAGSSVLLSKAVKEIEKPEFEFLKSFAQDLSDQSDFYPNNELSHFFSQTAYWLAEEKGKNVLALDFFRLSLEHNNEYEISLKGAAVVLQNQGEIAESLPLVEKLLLIQPNIKEYHQLLLNCYVGLKKKKELQIAVNNYLKLFPEDESLLRSKLGF